MKILVVGAGAMVDVNLQIAKHPPQDADRLLIGTHQQRFKIHV